MKHSNEKAIHPVMFSITLALTAAGIWAAMLCPPATAMASSNDANEQQISSAGAQESLPAETTNADTPSLGDPISETDEKPVDENKMQLDSEQSLSEKQKQQFFGRHIFFASNSFQLDYQAKALVREQAVWLAANPGVNIEIIGCCDQSGSKDYNMALGKKRAKAVKKFLVNLGISPQRLTEVSFGENSSVSTASDQNDARTNRRVEFKIQPSA